MARQYKVRFGFKTSQHGVSYPDIQRVWQAADANPLYEHAWLFDHFFPIWGNAGVDGPCMEGWTLLSALAAQTKRIRLGLMVAGNTYRNPALFAKMGATLDVISAGRLDFGLGAGWFEREHEAYGIPLYKPGERIRRFGEACEVIKLLWTEHTANFEGKYYQLKDAYCEPKPVQKPYPPLMLGGSGEKLTLRVVAQYADLWNYNGDIENFKRITGILTEHCHAVGRAPSDIEYSVQFFVNYENLAETREQVKHWVDAGASHIILNLLMPFPDQIIDLVGKEVIEPLAGLQVERV